MFKVGITGGIGSGKTVVCKVFEQLGVPVYPADAVAKELVAGDTRIKLKIKKHFGPAIYSEAGNLDRKKLAEIVFNDKQALKKLNSIVHPAMKKHFSEWLTKQSAVGPDTLRYGVNSRQSATSVCSQQPAIRNKKPETRNQKPETRNQKPETRNQKPYILKEAAILFESGAYKAMEAVITVAANNEIRIKRVMERDGATRQQVERIMKNQFSDEEKIGLSDYVINNDDSSLVIPQILRIHEDIIRRANTQS